MCLNVCSVMFCEYMTSDFFFFFSVSFYSAADGSRKREKRNQMIVVGRVDVGVGIVSRFVQLKEGVHRSRSEKS